MRSRIVLGTLLGALGGFLGYLIQEFSVPHDPILSATRQDFAKVGIYVGAMLGLALGMVEGIAVSSPRRLAQGAVIGLFIGGLGGLFGIYFGGFLFNFALFGKPMHQLEGSGNVLDFLQLVIARALGWTFLGAFPGLAAGAATLSRKRALHGLAGGLIGGFIGGLLFDIVGTAVAPLIAPATQLNGTREFDAGGPSRAIGFTAIGLFTGLFIGLVENYLKQAWVRVLAGKNEGKDYIISKPLTVVGRDERADIPLFGDPSLAPQHAAIKMEGNRHVLLDGGTPIGSVVNGQRVQQQLLRDGDMIQLGQARLLFREKATASRIARPAADAPKSPLAPGAVAMPSHLCPFCGAQKDAQGGCLCSVPGAGPGGGVPVGAGQSFGGGMNDPMAFGGQPAPYGGSGFGDPGPGGAGYDPNAGMGQAMGAGMAGPVGSFGSSGSRITALDGPYAGQSFPLNPGETSIGRGPENMIAMVNDSTVSRRHGRIVQDGTQHVVYDDGSSNGTFVNNVRVTVQALAPGDVIQFGASKYRYE